MSFTRVLRKTSRAFWTEFKSNRQVSCYCKRRAESKHEKLLINRRETWLTQISRQRRRRPLVRRPQLLCPSRASPQRPSTARAVPRIALANDDIVSGVGVASLGPGGARAPPDFLKLKLPNIAFCCGQHRTKRIMRELLSTKLFPTQILYNFSENFQNNLKLS